MPFVDTLYRPVIGEWRNRALHVLALTMSALRAQLRSDGPGEKRGGLVTGEAPVLINGHWTRLFHSSSSFWSSSKSPSPDSISPTISSNSGVTSSPISCCIRRIHWAICFGSSWSRPWGKSESGAQSRLLPHDLWTMTREIRRRIFSLPQRWQLGFTVDDILRTNTVDLRRHSWQRYSYNGMGISSRLRRYSWAIS